MASAPCTLIATRSPDLSILKVSLAKEPSLREVLMLVNGCKYALSKMRDQLNCIKEEMSVVRHDLQKVRECTTELEGRVSGVGDAITPMKQEIELLKVKVEIQNDKLEDLENRLRRNNVRIIDRKPRSPERSEGNSRRDFLEKCLQEIFGKEFYPLFAIERTYRVPLRTPPPFWERYQDQCL